MTVAAASSGDIGVLPAEMLANVLSFVPKDSLPHSMQVSRIWHGVINILFEENFWRAYDSGSYPETVRFLEMLIVQHNHNQVIPSAQRLFKELAALPEVSPYEGRFDRLFNESEQALVQCNRSLAVAFPTMSSQLQVPPERRLPDNASANDMRLLLNDYAGAVQRVTSLNLISRFLGTAPLEIGLFIGVSYLNLNATGLTSFPIAVVGLPVLESLHLLNNRLTSLPASIGGMTSLRILRLGWNQLATLPEEIGELANLQLLQLTHNRLTNLPHTFNKLIHLQELGLELNYFNACPAVIRRLPCYRPFSMNTQVVRMSWRGFGSELCDYMLHPLLIGGAMGLAATVYDLSHEPMSWLDCMKAPVVGVALGMTFVSCKLVYEAFRPRPRVEW